MSTASWLCTDILPMSILGHLDLRLQSLNVESFRPCCLTVIKQRWMLFMSIVSMNQPRMVDLKSALKNIVWLRDIFKSSKICKSSLDLRTSIFQTSKSYSRLRIDFVLLELRCKFMHEVEFCYNVSKGRCRASVTFKIWKWKSNGNRILA